jgi:hypothetical protein
MLGWVQRKGGRFFTSFRMTQERGWLLSGIYLLDSSLSRATHGNIELD